jgi:hypothetical protein
MPVSLHVIVLLPTVWAIGLSQQMDQLQGLRSCAWVQALLASGYQVYAINPMQAARYRERHSTSGAKSDPGDAHALAELVRLDRAAHRPIAGDSDLAEAIKLVARAHQTLVWDRHRHLLRLRGALREFFPAALDAFDDLTAPDALELLGAAPDPVTAASLSHARIRGALHRARRRNPAERAVQVQAALGAEQLGQPPVVTGAYAAIVRSLTAVITGTGRPRRSVCGPVGWGCRRCMSGGRVIPPSDRGRPSRPGDGSPAPTVRGASWCRPLAARAPRRGAVACHWSTCDGGSPGQQRRESGPADIECDRLGGGSVEPGRRLAGPRPANHLTGRMLSSRDQAMVPSNS